MTNQASTPIPNTAAAAPTDQAKEILLKDIGQRWSKFTPAELSRLKNNGDLVSQVVAKYGLEKVAVQDDVEFLLKGRSI